jgi:hypothetical protein
MFEITGDDIAALSDEDLRTLVGRLAEAELRRHGLSLSALTYGGNQTAADGDSMSAYPSRKGARSRSERRKKITRGRVP